MGIEIERKFLTVNNSYKSAATGSRHIMQGYLSVDPCRTVRVRIADNRAFITVKGLCSRTAKEAPALCNTTSDATQSSAKAVTEKTDRADSRVEIEFEVDMADAREMLKLALGTIIDKTRYLVPYEGYLWEVDEFHGARQGLVVAEVELPSADIMPPLPSFVGQEVTGDPLYYNSSLANPKS